MTGEFPSVLHRLWNNASTGTLERLDPAECIARYATSIQSAQRNVLLVASDDQVLPPNENPLINGSHAYGRWKFSAMSAMARDTARNSFDWICSGMDTKRPCSLGIDAIRDSSAESWLMGPGAGWPVKYCLSERADPTCKLHFEPTIGTIVTILNFVKAGVMFYVAFLVRDEPLMTMGDAVASFLERPDPTSKNRCLWAFANQRMFRDGKGIKHHGVGPQRWTCPQYRWKDATSPERRVVTIFMFLLALSVVTAFLAVGITALPPGITISQLDFVGLDPSSAIDMRNFPDSLVLKVVLANLPQLVFSLLYFSYNATLTAMLMSYEWVSYANKRKGLRVSHQPKGAQRCTYFLQLPYRFSIPLLLLSALLHWLVSQSLFLMSIDFYDSLGRPGDNDPYNSRFFGYQTVGFSPPAIVAVLVCGGLMTISIVVLGHIPYRRGMPVAGSSSMAISAACHLTTAEDEANEGTASSEKLQWGVVARADNGPGHCAFSPRLVEAPVKGRVYAGSFNPGL
ncbi:hypothetical protein AA0120_g10887 [Alternaria tenuissima]|nr:hypothetical protein AA0120_g10887 [Alternaria tenuissima]